jgi:hypothetical protein
VRRRRELHSRAAEASRAHYYSEQEIGSQNTKSGVITCKNVTLSHASSDINGASKAYIQNRGTVLKMAGVGPQQERISPERNPCAGRQRMMRG